MQPVLRRLSVVVGFTILVALVLVNTSVLRGRVRDQVNSHHAVVHTNEVLIQLELIGSMLKDGETGQRGYLYTARADYLQPYNAARQQIKGEIDKLAALTADNPHQQARISQLRELSDRKLEELAETVALSEAGKKEEARQLVLTNAGKRTMDQIRAALSEMRQEEVDLDRQRSANYANSVRWTNISLLLTTIVALFGLVGLAYAIMLEMRNRERHAAALLERESWFRITLGSIGDGVIATDRDGVVNFLNPVAESLTGYSLADGRGKRIEEVFPIFNEQTHLPVENPVAKVMSLGSIVGLANHTVLRRRGGGEIPIEDSAAPIRDASGILVGVVLVFRDATHDRRTQEVLRKTEKLATAARLASTMAHEINNPLEAVGNLLFLTKLSNDLPEESRKYLTSAEEELQRVFHITRQTLGFYRESRVKEETDLVALVESVLKMFGNKFRSKEIELIREFEPVPPMSLYSGELRQVVANLISNATDAVGHTGKITVSLRSTGQNGNGAIELAVQDNGSGIPAEHLPKLFEAFFTTKKDVGTGLGLWVVKEIVDRHNGTVQVHTDTGEHHGTRFTISLPETPQANSAVAQ